MLADWAKRPVAEGYCAGLYKRAVGTAQRGSFSTESDKGALGGRKPCRWDDQRRILMSMGRYRSACSSARRCWTMTGEIASAAATAAQIDLQGD